MTKVGDYFIISKIATGGMADVYLAKTSLKNGIEKFVALKCLLPELLCEKVYLDLFTNEARTQVNMNHGNVVSIYDFGMAGPKFYIAMEFVDGLTLYEFYKKRKKSFNPISIADIIYIIKEAAQGLGHAHSCMNIQTNEKLEIIHGDVSPDNIMLTVDGEVKVIDFGIAKFSEVGRNFIAGKKRYMPPAELLGKPLSFKSDVYALGRTFLELVRTHLGFEKALNSDNHIGDLEAVKEQLGTEVFSFLIRMLIQDFDVAYSKMDEVAKDLSVFLNINYPSYNKRNLGENVERHIDRKFLNDCPSAVTNKVETSRVSECKISSQDELAKLRGKKRPKKIKKIRRRRKVIRKKVS